MINFVKGFCYAVLQPAVTKRIGTYWQDRAQEGIGDVATVLLFGIAAGGC